MNNSYKFYGQFEPPVDQFLFQRYFSETDYKGVFVECGAFDGETESSCRFFEETLGWKGYNLEPVPWIWEKLCENRPHSNNLNIGLSNKSGTANFRAVNHPVFGVNCTNGSLEHTEGHRKFLEDNGSAFIDVNVTLKTWSEFVTSEKITEIDLLVLDVEGHELSVIEGMANSNVFPGIICIEVGHLSLNDIRNQLAKLGYSYDKSSHVNAYFVHKDYLQTLMLRKLMTGHEIQEQQQLIQSLQENNNSLLLRVNELTHLYNAVTTSKTWKMIEKLKKTKSLLSFASSKKGKEAY